MQTFSQKMLNIQNENNHKWFDSTSFTHTRAHRTPLFPASDRKPVCLSVLSKREGGPSSPNQRAPDTQKGRNTYTTLTSSGVGEEVDYVRVQITCWIWCSMELASVRIWGPIYCPEWRRSSWNVHQGCFVYWCNFWEFLYFKLFSTKLVNYFNNLDL